MYNITIKAIANVIFAMSRILLQVSYIALEPLASARKVHLRLSAISLVSMSTTPNIRLTIGHTKNARIPPPRLHESLNPVGSVLSSSSGAVVVLASREASLLPFVLLATLSGNGLLSLTNSSALLQSTGFFSVLNVQPPAALQANNNLDAAPTLPLPSFLEVSYLLQ